MPKRLRILAGPNGSGKSSVYESLRKEKSFRWGVFVNADEIEKQLRIYQFLDITNYGIDEFAWEEFKREYEQFVPTVGGVCGIDNLVYAGQRIVVINKELIDSYLACFIAEFLRRALLEKGGDLTFTIETVMSHPSKLDFIRTAKQKGFRVYLYFVATSSADINVGRVATRVQKGGHGVSEEKIRSRYSRSLANLRQAVLLSDRAYLFDNSGSSYNWIAEFDGNTRQITYKVDELPLWVEQSIGHK